MMNHPWECHLDISPHSSYMVLQTRTSYHKTISVGIISFSNSYNFFLFSSHTLAWACILHLKFLSMLAYFIYLSIFNWFQYNLCYCLPYAWSTSTAIFRFILSLTECTLHSRVKGSIIHISSSFVNPSLKEDCYINLKNDFTIICKTILS